MKKNTIFLLFVLVLFSSCIKNIKDCRFLPGIEPGIEKKSESDEKSKGNTEKIKDFIDSSNVSTEFNCKF